MCGLLGWFRVGLASVVWSCSSLALGAYVMRGWALSGVGWRGLSDLLFAPFYIIWKLALRLSPGGRGDKAWVRTTREVRP